MYGPQVSALNSCVTRNSTPISGGIQRFAGVERDVKYASKCRQDGFVSSLAKPGNADNSSSPLRASFLPSRRATKFSQPSLRTICKTTAAEMNGGPKIYEGRAKRVCKLLRVPIRTSHVNGSQEKAGVVAAIVPDQEEEQENILKKQLSPIAPTSLQVQSLLLGICDGTSITEFKVKVGDFELHMKRDVSKKTTAPAPPQPVPAQPFVASPPVTTVASPATPPKSNNSVFSILPATVSRTASLFGLLEAAADQGLSFVTSPKVGIFRRSRNAKGKTGQPLVQEGMTIKEGQIVGYLEQLGTQQPVEAQISGAVVQVLWEDGEAVGYGDPLISIRPSFPGIVSRGALN